MQIQNLRNSSSLALRCHIFVEKTIKLGPVLLSTVFQAKKKSTRTVGKRNFKICDFSANSYIAILWGD